MSKDRIRFIATIVSVADCCNKICRLGDFEVNGKGLGRMKRKRGQDSG